MHVLHLISSLRFGGAEKIAVGLAEEATRRGHRATILALAGGNDFRDRLDRGGIAYRSMGFERRFSPANLMHVAGLRRRLVRAVSGLAPDVVHSQLFTPRVVLYGMSSLAGRPVVQTQHDNPPWWRRSDRRSRLQRHVDRREP